VVVGTLVLVVVVVTRNAVTGRLVVVVVVGVVFFSVVDVRTVGTVVLSSLFDFECDVLWWRIALVDFDARVVVVVDGVVLRVVVVDFVVGCVRGVVRRVLVVVFFGVVLVEVDVFFKVVVFFGVVLVEVVVVLRVLTRPTPASLFAVVVVDVEDDVVELVTSIAESASVVVGT